MNGPISSALTADHHSIDAFLAAARNGDEASYQLFRIGLARHIGVEEKIILPALRAAGCDPPMARQLKLDHSALVAMLVPPPSPELFEKISTLLSLHNPLEEGPEGIYLAADRVLTDVDKIIDRMCKAPAPPMATHFSGERAYASIELLLSRAAEGRKTLR